MNNTTKKTKIVATIGPATSSKEMLLKLVKAGVNVCRLNFSHGKYADHEAVIKNVKEINSEHNLHIALLADLQGPKIRIGEVENNHIELKENDEVTFTIKECIGTKNKLYINYIDFIKDVKIGEQILVNDGNMIFEVLKKIDSHQVLTKAKNDGVLSSNKGVNLPNTRLSLPSLTEKDLKDLDFVLKHKIEWIALSFVRTARDIIELKHIISDKNHQAKVIAKIEKPQAINDIDEIIKASDGIMVARGDLGVEMPMQQVPLLQKNIVKKSQEYGKPVIIATQMMESMITNITPTRAEVNDVANAVLDGADALMLSGETSVGKYPIEVINSMCKIIKEIESHDNIYHVEQPPETEHDRFITDSICFNACRLAHRTKASAIVTMTFSGYTAFKVSSCRPKAGIYVFTGNPDILNTLSLVWGVKCFYYDKFVSTDHTISDIKYLLKKDGLVKDNDLVINIASMPISDKGQSNMLKLSYVE